MHYSHMFPVQSLCWDAPGDLYCNMLNDFCVLSAGKGISLLCGGMYVGVGGLFRRASDFLIH